MGPADGQATMTDRADWQQLNRVIWDEKAPLHLRSALYDVESFKSGRPSLKPHEIEDLADVAGKDLVHLQCHIGLDTLSWARLGARVTGLDFSGAAVAAATQLAQEIGVEARFVQADLYDAPSALNATYDIVYTGVGALCWLPDIQRWASVVHHLLRPGGELYLFEFHPAGWMFEDRLEVRQDYFTPPEGCRFAGSVTYADGSSPNQTGETIQWKHPLGAVVTALVKAGLAIEELRELDRDVLQRWPFMERDADGLFRMPAGQPSMPLMYTLRARRPSP
jgi:SAM-dependent methyltransferase